MPLTQKEKEIESIIESVCNLDAEDFQKVIEGMARQANGTHKFSGDVAWKKAAGHLYQAANEVEKRLGN